MNVIVAVVAVLLTYILMKAHVVKYSIKVLGYVAAACLIGVPIFLTIPMNYFCPAGELRVARNTIPVIPRVPGQVTQVFVESGQKVKQGQPLFAIDPSTFQEQVDALEASLADSETRKHVLDEQVRSAEASLGEAQQKLASAEVQFTSTPQEQLRQAEAQTSASLANYLLAGRQLQRVRALFETKTVSQSEYDSAREKNAVSENDYRSAASAYQQASLALESGTRQVSTAQEAVRQAESALRQARINSDAEIKGMNPLVAQAKAQLETARLNLEWTTVTAALAGTVLNVQLQPGLQVGTAPTMVLQNDRDTKYFVSIKQSTLRHVRAGNEVEMFFDLFPGKHFNGKVVYIGQGVQEGQLSASGNLMSASETGKRSPFAVQLEPEDAALADRLPTGAGGTASIFTGKYRATEFPRKFLSRAFSWLKLVVP
jgi:multidrug resistance efflux pump